MCDYSLAHYPNRLAVKDEELVIHDFHPTKGFVAVEAKPKTGMPFFGGGKPKPLVPCVVCLPPGAKLVLLNIPGDLQEDLGIGQTEEVTFDQFSAREDTYRDGVRFKNGRRVLLQRLPPGLRATVLSTESEEQPVTRGERRKEVYA